MIILSPICNELDDFSPFPYYYLQMKATEKKKQKIDHKSGMWKNGKAPIVPGKFKLVSFIKLVSLS